jgi:hypothetical protein
MSTHLGAPVEQSFRTPEVMGFGLNPFSWRQASFTRHGKLKHATSDRSRGSFLRDMLF